MLDDAQDARRPPAPSAAEDASVFLDEPSATTMLLESIRRAADDGNNFVLSPAVELYALGKPHWLSRQLLLVAWCVLWCDRPAAMEALLFMHVNHLKLACAATWAVRSCGWLPADDGQAQGAAESQLRLLRAVEHTFINQQRGATYASAEHKLRRAELLDLQARFLDSLASVPETLRANKPELRHSLAKALIGASCASTLPAQLVLPTHMLAKRPYVVVRAPLNAVKVISTRERCVVLLLLEVLHVDGSADGSALLQLPAGAAVKPAGSEEAGAAPPRAETALVHEPSWEEVALGLDARPDATRDASSPRGAVGSAGGADCALPSETAVCGGGTRAARPVRLAMRASSAERVVVTMSPACAAAASTAPEQPRHGASVALQLVASGAAAVTVRLAVCAPLRADCRGASQLRDADGGDAPEATGVDAPREPPLVASPTECARAQPEWQAAQLAALQAHVESLRVREAATDPLRPQQRTADVQRGTQSPACPSSVEADIDMTARSWAEVRHVVASSSPYSHVPGWAVVPMLIKSNANMLLEQLAQQLLGEVRAIFELERTPLRLRTYEVRAVSPTAGFVEVIPDAPSLHELKRRLGSASLRDHFRACYGEGSADGDGDPIGTAGARRPPYAQAVDNFACSLAANAVASYVLQVKDRHNGNILLTSTGAIVHVDFGFILGLAPGGSFAVEKAPFKLTAEWIDLMGGAEAPMVQRFRSLCAVGMLALRRHAPRLLAVTEAALALCRRGGPLAWKLLPCLQHGDEAVLHSMRARLMLNVPDDVVCERTNRLVDDSLAAWSTTLYDRYQNVANNIEW